MVMYMIIILERINVAKEHVTLFFAVLSLKSKWYTSPEDPNIWVMMSVQFLSKQDRGKNEKGAGNFWGYLRTVLY